VLTVGAAFGIHCCPSPFVMMGYEKKHLHTSLKYLKLTIVPSENKNETLIVKSKVYVTHSTDIVLTKAARKRMEANTWLLGLMAPLNDLFAVTE
jgi:hypothetical protein